MAEGVDHLSDDAATLKAALIETRAKLSGAEALIEHLQLVIAKMKRAMFGPRSERTVTIRSRPRGWLAAFVLWEHLLQAFHSGGREGDGLAVISVVDPEAAVLRLHVRGDLPQQRLVLAEDFGGTADGDGVGWGRHGQAARAT